MERIVKIVASTFGLEESRVNQMAEDQSNDINSFLSPNGTLVLLWVFTPESNEPEEFDGLDDVDAKSVASMSSSGNSSDTLSSYLMKNNFNKQTESKENKLTLETTFTNFVLKTSHCAYFLKSNKELEISEKNFHTEVIFGHITGKKGLLNVSEKVREIFLPMMKQQDNWGDLNFMEHGNQINDFLTNVNRFVISVEQSQRSIAGAVKLALPKKAVQNQASVQKEEYIRTLEETVKDWMEKIEIVLGEVTSIREEKDDMGPSAEVEYWKNRMGQLSYILDQTKKKTHIEALRILRKARSQVYKTWQELDLKITDATNEAKDNVKYLSILESFLEPLHSSDPVQMISLLEPLLKAIKVMYSIAKYYSNAEHMTSLFVKITNEMIHSCKDYITKDGSLWDQPKDNLIKKFQDVIDLKINYQHYYTLTKKSLEKNPYGKQFDFSETAIFGKFEDFHWRIQKLIDLYKTAAQFSVLAESSIENIEPIIKRFNAIIAQFQKKKYDFLDFRPDATTFDEDYRQFNEEMSRLEKEFIEFIKFSFDHAVSTRHAIDLLAQFRAVIKQQNLLKLLDEKLELIFSKYGEDLERIKRIYEKYKENPKIPLNAPVCAGSIGWSRQLWREVEEPMNFFNRTLFAKSNTSKSQIVKNYNKIVTTLFKYETRWYKKWRDSVKTARDGLLATVFVRHPTAGGLFVNFDNQLLVLLKEVKWLKRMGFAIPDSAMSIYNQSDKLKLNSEKLNHLLQEYRKVKTLPNQRIQAILKLHYKKIDHILSVGENVLSWSSLNLSSFMEESAKMIKELEDLILKGNTIIELRINQNIQRIRTSTLILFSEEVQTITEFEKEQMEYAHQVAKQIEILNKEIESGTLDLVELLTKNFTEAEKETIKTSTFDLWNGYREDVNDSVIDSLIASVKILKNRISLQEDKAVLSVEIVKPIGVKPSNDEITKCVNRVARGMLEATKNIFGWEHESSSEKKSIFDDVGKSKKTVKGFLQLVGAVESLFKRVEEFKTEWNKNYHRVLEDNKELPDRFDESGDASLEEFEKEIKKYAEIEQKMEEEEKFKIIGALRIDLSPISSAIRKEANEWKYLFGNALNERIKTKMEELVKFMEETKKSLLQDIEDHDSLNRIMSVLEKLWEEESEIDAKMKPIEETYAVLNFYNVSVSREEQEQVDEIRNNWKQLITLARDKMNELKRISGKYKKELENGVKDFKKQVEEFKQQYDEKGPTEKGIAPSEAQKRLRFFKTRFEEKNRKWKSYKMGEKLFGLEETEYPVLVDIDGQLKLLSKLYDLYQKVETEALAFQRGLLWDADLDTGAQKFEQFDRDCKLLPKKLKNFDAFTELTGKVDRFKQTIEILYRLREKSVKERHWKLISDLCGTQFDYKNTTEFKIEQLVAADISKHSEDIDEIITVSKKELEIDNKLARIEVDWTKKEFAFKEFRGKLILKDTNDLKNDIEESLVTLSTLMGNVNNGFFKDRIQHWINKLSTTQAVLDDWLKVQALWIYMEAVFNGGDIVKELPKVAKRFQQVDKNWETIMTLAFGEKNVVKLCSDDKDEMALRANLNNLKDNLDKCQKSLSGYLESKRMLFPRFYFLSDTQLLKILGQGSDPTTIQEHLQSIFANISKIEFDPEKKRAIIAMISGEGEKVPFTEPLVASENIEEVLQKLVIHQCNTINDIAREMVSQIGMLKNADKVKLNEFIDTFPSQISLLGIQLLWTHLCEEAIKIYNRQNKKSIINETKQKFEKILSHLVDFTTSEKLTMLERTRIETLITIHTHQVKIFNDISENIAKIKSIYAFDWLKQTRFYWNQEKDNCVIKITDVDFLYCNEFLGCRERLVITALTDRIYISCAQAMGMYLGGAPAGPAGTGKTETTKDMGTTMGKFFITINCSDQMTYTSMGILFKGIAQSGIWCGFDEINRVHLEVLSVVAAQIKCIFDAMKKRKDKFTFVDGIDIKLDNRCAIFLTMNPGYAGRTELPENMKVLFRTIAVVVPDRKIIMEVKLASSGFHDFINLAQKFFTLYQLCEEQLSKQRHYDFGLRNILAVLRTCGPKLRQTTATQPHNNSTEANVLMQVLRDMNVSKLVDQDSQLFLDLLSDLFPEPKKIETTGGADSYQELLDFIKKTETFKTKKLQEHLPWIQKIFQLYDQYKVRHGLCVMGPSGSGKSSCIHCLAEALTLMSLKTNISTMNPKSITQKQMFGILDKDTNDWTDGIFSALWRNAMESELLNKKDFNWIVLDGPVDTRWIEDLNTVLDDTKTLTLANGDRLLLPKSLKLVFEVGDLNNASPATVSRMGIVYIGQSVLQWPQIFASWKLRQTMNNKFLDILERLFNASFSEILEYTISELTLKMQILPVNLVSNCLTILDALLEQHSTHFDGRSMEDLEAHIEKMYLFGLTWSLGAVLETEDRLFFYRKLKEMGYKFAFDRSKSALKDTVFDFYISTSGKWTTWGEILKEEIETSAIEAMAPVTAETFTSYFVPTVDSVRSTYLIDLVSRRDKSVLVIGQSGTAKTLTMQKYFEKLDNESKNNLKTSEKKKLAFKNKFLAFSNATTPGIVQQSIFASLDNRTTNSFGPPAGKKMLIFVDDINMPEINEWGDQETNEIVRQLIEHKGFYSLDPSHPGLWLNVVDCQYFAAMNQPGGGRNDIPARLKRHFAVFNITFPSDESIDHIYSTILGTRFSNANGFSKDVLEGIVKIPGMTRLLWQNVKKQILPTPSKFHCIFSLRDLSRIFQGMVQISSEVARNSDYILKLWKHECDRVLYDKLTNEADREKYQHSVSLIVRGEKFYEDSIKLVEETSYFCDFLREAKEPEGDEMEGQEVTLEDPKVYELVPSMDVLSARLYKLMERYNEKNKKEPLNLVLFNYAMQHLMRVSRIIRMSRGNCLLVGVGGSGKQSLTALAAFIAGQDLFKLEVNKLYNLNSFFEDLRKIYKAVLKKPVTFLFTDNDIKEENFLEYINMMLASGEIANLFSKEERDMMLEELKGKLKDPHILSPEELYKKYLTYMRDNLHIALCFSPIGDKFRTRARQFPGLISGCTIDWYDLWPFEALHATAENFLNSFDIVCEKKTQKNELVNYMCGVHQSVHELTKSYFSKYRRQTHVTPKSYLSFLTDFKENYSEKYAEMKKQEEKFGKGLKKLEQATQDVAKMKQDLIEKESKLSIAKAEAEVLLEKVSKEKKKAEKKTKEVLDQKQKLEVEKDAIEKAKEEAERDLAAAKPELEKAQKALDAIKPGDIAQVKTMLKPPPLVKRVMDTVLILKKEEIDRKIEIDQELMQKEKRALIKANWSASIKMMSDTGFLNSLLHFNPNSLNDETVELLQPYLREPDLTTESVLKVSSAVAGLCNWVICMKRYHELAKEVAPKIQAVQDKSNDLARALKVLGIAEADLAEKQKNLDKLNAELNEQLRKKQILEDDANETKRRMKAAEALIEGLSGERTRWTEESKSSTMKINRLLGDAALSATFMSYCGAFNQEFRSLIVNDVGKAQIIQKKLPFTDNLKLTHFIVHPTVHGSWTLHKLPDDDHSIQNAIIVSKGSRYPLLIDPQGQAKEWIKDMWQDKLITVTQKSRTFKDEVEKSITLGLPLLIEDIEEDMDPMLNNLLEKKFIKGAKRLKLILGGNEIIFNTHFKLFMTTKIPNPQYSPEVYAKCSVIDFTVTQKGLEDQLLSIVIVREMEELEKKKTNLMQEMQNCKQIMEECEEELLEKLSKSESNLIDDEDLIKVLREVKTKAKEMKIQLANAEETEKSITQAREEFRPVAVRGSVMYFTINELGLINFMYQVSLNQFITLFIDSISNSKPDRTLSKRIKNITDFATFSIFKYVQRGIYEKHKIIFSFLLCLKMELKAGKITPQEFGYLLKGGAALTISGLRRKPVAWMTEESWLHLSALVEINKFKSLIHQIENNSEKWFEVYNDPKIHLKTDFPDNYKLGAFDRLLLLRALREDKVLSACHEYIIEVLGEKYVTSIPLNLEETWKETDQKTPVVFLLSPGADLTASIENLSDSKKIPTFRISMGQGQEIKAHEYITTAQQSGGWVLLQNCHLGINYLKQLEELLQGMDMHQCEPTFRVWITTEPTASFPINLLQMSIKVTDDPPTGIKASLLKSYSWITQEMLEQIETNKWRKLLFATCFLHACVIERKKFGPLGWCVPYEFNQTDLECSVEFLRKYIYESEDYSFDTIRYMVCEVQYGGRITDDMDKTLLNAYGEIWLTKQMFTSDFSFYYAEEEASLSLSKEETDLRKVYEVKDFKAVDEYTKFIDSSIPLFDSPKVFGLHENAEISFNSKAGKTVLDSILNVQPKDSPTGAVESREQVVLRIIATNETKIPSENYDLGAIEKKLKQRRKKGTASGQTPANGPQPTNAIDNATQKPGQLGSTISNSTPIPQNTLSKTQTNSASNQMASNPKKTYESKPLDIFLCQELQRINYVLSEIRKSFSDLKLAIAGTIIMSNELQSIFDALFDSKVPEKWRKISWESPTLGYWFQDMTKRITQYSQWIEGEPKLYWLGGFFNPQGFLTAVKQEKARASNWPLDTVMLKTEVTKKDKEQIVQAPQGAGTVYVYGMYLEGAGWDRNHSKLRDLKEKQLIVPLPVIKISGSDHKEENSPDRFEIPVYQIPKRTGLYYVFKLGVNIETNTKNQWILEGVACLLSKQ